MPFAAPLRKKIADDDKILTLDDRIKQGLSEYGAQQFHVAKATFTELTQEYPHLSELWLQLGNCDYRLRAYLLAEKSWKECLRLNPLALQVYINLGSLYYEQKKYEEAEYHWKVALKIDETHKMTWLRLGDLYKLQGNIVKSYQYHMKYAELAGEKDLESQRVKRRYEQGLGAYQANIRISYDCMYKGQLDHARRAFSKAFEYYPGDAKAYKAYGATLYKLNRMDDAAHAYTQAVELEPNDAGNYINLGVILEKQGHTIDAAWCYQQGITKGKDPAATQKLEQRVKQLTATRFNEKLVDYFFKAQEAIVEFKLIEASRRLGRLREMGPLTQVIHDEIQHELTKLSLLYNPKKQAEQTFLQLGNDALKAKLDDITLHFYEQYLTSFPSGEAVQELRPAVEQLKERIEKAEAIRQAELERTRPRKKIF
ncbi:MAG: tetratricopeptide repeat protein [Vampirovibrionales bacterium]|nr:tetratricopeptide repeat protein [Vampirovibrionales bacterium]